MQVYSLEWEGALQQRSRQLGQTVTSILSCSQFACLYVYMNASLCVNVRIYGRQRHGESEIFFRTHTH